MQNYITEDYYKNDTKFYNGGDWFLFSTISTLIEDGVDEESAEKIILFRYYVSGWLSMIVGIGGLIGNLLCAIVLSRPHMRKQSVNILQLGLTICDSFLILLLLSDASVYQFFGQELKNSFVEKWNPMISLCFNIAKYVAYTVAVIFTAMLTFERYIAVCRPISSRSLITKGKTLIAVKLVIVISVIWAITFELFLENRRRYEIDPSANTVIILYEHQSNFEDENLKLALISIINALVWYILPVTLMFVCNLKICAALRKFKKTHKQLTCAEISTISVTTPVVCIVTLSLISCMFHIVYVMCFFGLSVERLITRFYMSILFYFLIVLNSSANFVFYCLFGSEFRKQLVNLFCNKSHQVFQQNSTFSRELSNNSQTISSISATIT